MDPKMFIGLSSGIGAMRKNVIAVRKTLIKKNQQSKKVTQKEKLFDKRLEDTKAKNQKEESREAKRGLKTLNLKGAGNRFFKKPELAFKMPGMSILESIFGFFSFVLFGWMLKALPTLKKSVQEFITKAKDFIKSLEGIWNSIKGFFTFIFDGLESLYTKLGFGGSDALKQGDEFKVKDMLSTLADSIQKIITDLPKTIIDFISSVPKLLAKRGTAQGGSNYKAGGLFGLISGGEGDVNSYNTGVAGSQSGFTPSKPFTEMTPDQVYGLQKSGKIFAVGKYQIIPGTMKEFLAWAKSQGINTSSGKFDEAFQDQFAKYVLHEKRAKVGRFLSGDASVSMTTAQLELAAEFASVGVPTDMKAGSYAPGIPAVDIKRGESLYKEYMGAGNVASISPDKIAVELNAIKSGTSTASFIPSPATAERNGEREDTLSRSGGPKQIDISREVIIPIQLNRTRREDYTNAFAAADSIKIYSIDGDSVTEDLIGG